MLQLSN